MITNQQVNNNEDIHDSAADEAKMQPETFTIDLPDVSDIPGQENIHVRRMGEMADTTISSADEEGEGLFGNDEDNDDDDEMGYNPGEDKTDSNVTKEEKNILQNAMETLPSGDDDNLRTALPDNTDNEGDLLNEGNGLSGADLDTSGIDEDDNMENMGEEDEENNAYSLGGDDNDDTTEGTP